MAFAARKGGQKKRKERKKEGEREADECWQSAVRVKPLRSVIGPGPTPSDVSSLRANIPLQPGGHRHGN